MLALALGCSGGVRTRGDDAGAGGDTRATGDGSTTSDTGSSMRDSGPVGFDVAAIDSSSNADSGSRDGGTTGEVCFNGLDDNGDGMIDESCACLPGETQRCFTGSADNAGIGACAFGMQRCEGTGEFGAWSACGGAVLPAGEACDGADNDCDGVVDDGCECRASETRGCYTGPAATRGIGVCADGTQTCASGAGGIGSAWGACGGETLPGAEACDGVDNDCNGTVDDGCACTPGMTRACYGGPMGTQDVGLCRAGTQTCETTGAGSAWGACSMQVLPAGEACDGIDNDCDGMVDDGCNCMPGATRACYGGPMGTSGIGLCRPGMQTCVAGMGGIGSNWGACSGEVVPSRETCDDADNNCDGTTDDGCVCRRGETRACYTGPSGTSGVGICLAGTQACVISGGMASWGACTGQTLPGTESCNMRDDDCNGTMDDGCACTIGATRACYGGPMGTENVGPCRGGMQTCVASGAGSAWGTCTGQTLPGRETCNMADDDCDGTADDGLSCTGPSAMCPAPITVDAGSTVTLTGTVSGATSYLWEVIAMPAGATYTLGSPTAATTTFTSVIVGAFTVRLTVTDTMGRTATCTVVITMRGHGFRVEMVWDRMNDIDLHVHNRAAPQWWTVDDCHWTNRSPSWDGPGVMDDPRLDTDDTDGLGPENIRVDAPPTTQIYTVGAHWWGGSSMQRTTVTIRIYCGETLRGTYMRTVRNVDDFWRVARVQFTDASTCTITPIDDVITGSMSRAGSP